MKTSDYRREYAAYYSALERERYNYHSGLKLELNLEAVHDRYADLWTREAIDDLQRTWSETPIEFATERAGLRVLAGAARLKYIEAHVAELTNESKRCESFARVEWEGATLAARDVPDRIADETDAWRRRELAARWIDAFSACDDLRAAGLESQHESARALGFDSYRALLREVTGTDDERLASAANNFLDRTAPTYRSHLTQWATHTAPPVALNNLTFADSLFFSRMICLERFFPARDLRTTYSTAMAGLGIRTEKQNNIHISEVQNSLNLRFQTSHLTGSRLALCFGIKPPDEVRLVAAVSGGANSYLSFFHAAGCAQHFGWASPDLAARYPEFIHAPDRATRMGYAFLFGTLLYDGMWLSEQRNVKVTEARDMARSIALREMHNVRRCCAKLHYLLTLHTTPNPRSEQLSEAYAALLSEATNFRHDSAMYLLEAGDLLCTVAQLRARLFSAGLREHLRARYGYRWWAVRAAGDELIDMWNTASQYSVEELARLVGAGALNFDLLAETLIAAMNEG